MSQENFQYHQFLPGVKFKGKTRVINLINKVYSVFKLREAEFDVFHPTYYNPYFLKYIGDKPFVLTIHDMIHERFNTLFPVKDKTSECKKLLVEKANKIITVSENTKKDLIEIFGTNESKIEVIHHGNSMFPKQNLQINIKLPERYILFVGLRGGYKNFKRFIKAIAPLLNDDKGLYVICAGGGKFNRAELNLFKDCDIESNVKYYQIKNDDFLSYLYSNAIAFVYPSLYEGFGIPILEAFSCGCPVVLSDASSFPEVAGDAGLYFDPYDQESIRKAVFNIISNKDARKDLIEKGHKRLKLFSWDKAASLTLKVYKSL